jgi:hypothetical protein
MEPHRRIAAFFLALFGVTLALHLCHSHILWADEDYHLAAGIQTLHGKLLYRDLWYDKPPLSAWVYAALGGVWGWPLRLFDAIYVTAICVAIYRFARDLGGEREGLLAAALAGLFLNFDFAFAVIPIAPDLFMVLPHIAAVHCAWRGRPLGAGVWSGVAFLFHTKGVFAVAMCALLAWRSLPLLALGFVIPNAAALAVLGSGGALAGYVSQVWEWGFTYAGSSPESHPWWNAMRRTMDWMGFHAVLLLGTVCFFWTARTRERRRMAAWIALSFAGVALGSRLALRYFFQLLPAMVLAGAAGVVACQRRKSGGLARAALLVLASALALVPVVRFAPRYFTLARDLIVHQPHHWADVALDQDSQAAAAELNVRKRRGSSLMVWGYRPGIFVYTRLPAGSRFWDSQPLTGVPADRHLTDSVSIAPVWAARNRVELAESRPSFLVDSLSLSNPALSPSNYPELHAWMGNYRLVARTNLSLIYEFNETALPLHAVSPPPPPSR